MPDYDAIISTPVGLIGICTGSDAVTQVDLNLTSVAERRAASRVGAETVDFLRRYFEQGQWSANTPLQLSGTEFQQRVWRSLLAIPVGAVLTYGELAGELKSSARAVGQACRRNPTPVVVPCHRVVAASGLGGFAGVTAGAMSDIKRWLLHHEGVDL
jgi:methylated-DNA-[protein]-cysteine S-methyltransferase